MRLIQFTSCLIVFASPSLGEPRYQIDGNTLTFNMGVPGGPGEFTGQLEYYDLREIGELIFESVGVEVLKVTGPGGSMIAAREIANKVINHNLDTVAYGDCMSACTMIFLAGKKRTLAENSRLGFHKQLVVKRDHKPIYEAYKDAKGWEDDTSKITTIYKDIVERYKKDCKIDKYQFPEEWTWEGLRINKYEDNGTDEFFNHIDVNGHKAARRFLTIFCYLDDNVAGETDFPEFGWRGKLREKLAFRSPCKKGSVLLFPPMWPWTHRGNKPKNKPKYILQTYLHYV